jgi:hypothetical protein
MRDILGTVNERDRLLLPGLRTLLEAPSPRRVLLRQELDPARTNQTSLTKRGREFAEGDKPLFGLSRLFPEPEQVTLGVHTGCKEPHAGHCHLFRKDFSPEALNLFHRGVNGGNTEIIHDALRRIHPFSHTTSDPGGSIQVGRGKKIVLHLGEGFEFPSEKRGIKFLRSLNIICWYVKMNYRRHQIFTNSQWVKRV